MGHMKKLLALIALSFVLAPAASAHEGAIDLTGNGISCKGISIYQDGTYRVSGRCDGLVYPYETLYSKYVLWGKTTTRGEVTRIAEIDRGYFAGSINGEFDAMYVTASPVATPSPTPTGKPENGNTGEPNAPTTKGGLPIEDTKVKGAKTYVPSTKTKTTTVTTSHLTLTLVKSSVCPVSYMTEVKDISGPLTLRYELIKDTSFGITVWGKDGNELLQNTTYSGNSGTIKTISGVDYMKVRVESKSCASNNDNWIRLTAER